MKELSENFLESTAEELIELVLQLEVGMYDHLPQEWRNPGLSLFCALRLVSDHLQSQLNQCRSEVKAFIKKVDDVSELALAALDKAGKDAIIKPLFTNLFEAYRGGFERRLYTEAEFEHLAAALQGLPKTGQLVYRPEDGRFFVLIDNGYIERAQRAEKLEDYPNAAIGHAHITVNEGMHKAESEKCWLKMDERFGETSKPLYLAKQAGLRYLNKTIHFAVVGAYEGKSKTNSRFVSTEQLHIQSDDLMVLASEGLGPCIKDYTYHVTFAQRQRQPYAGLASIGPITHCLSESPLSMRLRDHICGFVQPEAGQAQPAAKAVDVSFLIKAYVAIKKVFEAHKVVGTKVVIEAQKATLYINYQGKEIKEIEASLQALLSKGGLKKQLEIKLIGKGEAQWMPSDHMDFDEFCEALNKRGKACYRQGKDSDALTYYQQSAHLAALLYGETSLVMAKSHHRIAKLYYHMSQNNEALEQANKAAQLYSKVSQKEAEKTLSLIRIFTLWGSIYYKKGQYEESLERQLTAEAMAQSLSPIENPSRVMRKLSKIYSHLGNLYAIKANPQYTIALDYHSQALALAKQVYGITHRVTAWIYGNMGNTHYKKGEITQGLACQKTSVEIQEQLDPFHPGLAKAYNNLGQIYAGCGKEEEALAYFNKALALAERQAIHKEAIKAVSYSHQGKVYYHQGENQKALECFYKALTIDQKLHGDRSFYAATSYHWLGNIYRERGQDQKAIENHKKALAIYRGDAQKKDHYTRYAYQWELARTYFFAFVRQTKATHVKEEKTEIAQIKGKSPTKDAQAYIDKAIQLLEDLQSENEKIIDAEKHSLSSYDLLSYDSLLGLLGNCYVANGNASYAGALYKRQAEKWHEQFLPLALHWIRQGLLYFSTVTPSTAEMAALYHLRAVLAFKQRRYRYALSSLQKALWLEDRPEWQKAFMQYRAVLNHYSEHIEEDIYVQLEAAQETYYELEKRYLSDLQHTATLSEYTKNRTVELLIKLRNILDIAYSRLVRETIFKPNQRDPHEIPYVYYPFAGSEEAFVHELSKSGIIHVPGLKPEDIDFKLKELINFCHQQLQEKGYIDTASRLTAKAYPAETVVLHEMLDPCLWLIQQLIRERKEGALLDKKILGQAKLLQNAIKPPDKGWLLQRLVQKGYLSLDQALQKEEYQITEKFLSLRKGAPLELEEVGDTEAIRRSLRAYVRMVYTQMQHCVMKAKQLDSLEDDRHQAAYTLLKQEQTFWYYKRDNNLQNKGFWRGSWLEKLNAIQNESKHIRLTPQGLESNVHQLKGSLIKQQVKVNIEYLELRLYGWSFVELVLPFTPTLSDHQQIQASRQLLRFLKDKKYVNQQLVDHALTKDVAKKVREKASEEAILQAKQAFITHFEQMLFQEKDKAENDGYFYWLKKALLTETAWRALIKTLANYLLRKALQRGRVMLTPDLIVDAPWLLKTALEKVWIIVERFAEVRSHYAKAQGKKTAFTALLSEGPSQVLSPRLRYLKEGVKTQPPGEEALTAFVRAPVVTLTHIVKQHSDLEALSRQYRFQGQWDKAGEAYYLAARLVSERYPWLALKYYVYALENYQQDGCRQDKYGQIAEEAAKAFYAQQCWPRAHYHLRQALAQPIKEPAHRQALKKLLQDWEGEEKKRHAWIDSDIDTQLVHYRDQYNELLYLVLRLYSAPPDRLLAYQIQTIVIDMLIKIRHLLDQGLGRFIKVCLSKDRLVNLWDAHYPCTGNVERLRDFLFEDINKQDPGAFTPETYPLLMAGSPYADVYQAIVETQPFSSEHPLWLQQIQGISNLAKHVRVPYPSVTQLEVQKKKADQLEAFYPLCYSEERIYDWSFTGILGEIDRSTLLVEELRRCNILKGDGKVQPYGFGKGIFELIEAKLRGDVINKSFEQLVIEAYTHLKQVPGLKLTETEVKPIINILFHHGLNAKGHFDAESAQWVPALTLLHEALRGVEKVLKVLFKHISATQVARVESASLKAKEPLSPSSSFSLEGEENKEKEKVSESFLHTHMAFFKPSAERIEKTLPTQEEIQLNYALSLSAKEQSNTDSTGKNEAMQSMQGKENALKAGEQSSENREQVVSLSKV